MEIVSYELINDEYKVTFSDGDIIYVSKKKFENTMYFAINELKKSGIAIIKGFNLDKLVYWMIRQLNKLTKK